MADERNEETSVARAESKAIRRSYETAERIMHDDDPEANDLDARGTEIGSPLEPGETAKPTR